MMMGRSSSFGSDTRSGVRRGCNSVSRLAFTLVELMVVVAILAILTALVLAAVQVARESARRVTCQNNLRQIGLGVHQHLGAHGHFPTGGWGYRWTGDPDRGFGPGQPGGWVYSLLPYVEQQNLHALGVGLPDAEKKAAAARRMETPVPLFSCPTRRAAIQYPVETFAYRERMLNSAIPDYVTRGDYAINVGNYGQNTYRRGGPSSVEIAETTFKWLDPEQYTGLSFAHSQVRQQQVIDGMSKTLLIGEKYLNPEIYDTGDDPSDGGHILGGFSRDTFRLAGAGFQLKRDSYGHGADSIFGSAHSHCHFVFCDGHVQVLDYDIDFWIYEMLATRNGQE